MKRDDLILLFGLFFLSLLSSCVYVVDAPGPDGRPGNAYYGVDYRVHMPYSYADNNPAIPYNPVLGNYYLTQPGTYEFEYFVNPYDYWYGTYSVYINPGEPGGPRGYAGRDGRDTYLMMICEYDGFYEIRGMGKTDTNADKTVTISGMDSNNRYEVTMTRTSVSERQPRLEAKFVGH